MASRTAHIFTVDIDQLLAGYAKLSAAQARQEQGFARTAAAGRASFNSLEQAMRRHEAQLSRLAAQTVARTRLLTGGAALSMTPMMRAAAASGGTSAFVAAAQDLSFQRFLRAQQIRGQRTDARAIGMAQLVSGAHGQIVAEREARRQRIADAQLEAFGARMEAERARPVFFSTQNRLGGMLGGAVVGAAVIHKLTQGIQQYGLTLERASAQNVEFEETMTPLLSLGNNLANAPAFKRNFLAESLSRGIPVGQLASARFNFLSGAGNLPKNIQSQIWQQAMLLTQVKGGNIEENVNALVKLQQVFGGSFRSVKQMASTLAFTEAEGTINMSELATYAPDVFPTFKTGGYGFEDFAAALQVTTQRLGRNEPTLRQLRNLPMRMLKAQDVLGFKFQSSSFGGRLGEIRSRLQGMGRDQQLSAISQIFEAEGAVVAATLLENLGQFQQSRQRVAGVGENFLMGRAIQRGTDPAYSMAMLSRSAGILRENIGAELAQDPEALKKATLWELTRTGAELTLRKEQPWLTDEEIRRQAAGEMGLYGARNRYAALTINKITDAALQSAGPDMASREALIWQNYMQRIQLGMVKDADTSAMNQQDAQELARAWQAGYRFSPESLAEYHRLQAADPTGRAAAGWMARQRRWAPARFDRVAEPDAAALPAGGDLVEGARKMAEAAQHFLTFAQANSGPAPAAPSQPAGPAGTP